MSEAELKAAAERLRQIETTRQSLQGARRVLALVNEHVTAGKIWKTRLELQPAKPYDPYTRVEIVHIVHGRHVQQRAVDEVARLKRRLVQLGASE